MAKHTHTHIQDLSWHTLSVKKTTKNERKIERKREKKNQIKTTSYKCEHVIRLRLRNRNVWVFDRVFRNDIGIQITHTRSHARTHIDIDTYRYVDK